MNRRTHPTSFETWSSHLTIPAEVRVRGEQERRYRSMEKWTRQHHYSEVTGLWSLCWLLECFSVKSFFIRRSFISKMLTQLRPQEQARKLETFTCLKAYKNNPLPFSGQMQGAAAVYITLPRVLEALLKGEGTTRRLFVTHFSELWSCPVSEPSICMAHHQFISIMACFSSLD